MVATSQGTSFNMFLLTMKDNKGLSLIECETCFEQGKTIQVWKFTTKNVAQFY